NGTQEIFAGRCDVLTISIHGDPSYAYPYFAGFADERGEGEGAGYNHNFPLPENVGDDDYLRTLAQAVELIARFAPRYLVVSVGLDIAKGDPTGAWAITTDGFERIGRAIAALGLPTLAVQEGGYDTRVIGRNARALLGGLQMGAGSGRLRLPGGSGWRAEGPQPAGSGAYGPCGKGPSSSTGGGRGLAATGAAPIAAWCSPAGGPVGPQPFPAGDAPTGAAAVSRSRASRGASRRSPPATASRHYITPSHQPTFR